jgi:hypothetical protein
MPTGGVPLFYLNGDNNGVSHLKFTALANGTIQVERMNPYAVLGTTNFATPVPLAYKWCFLEFKVVASSTTSGSISFRYNGSPIGSLTGIQTLSTGIANYYSHLKFIAGGSGSIAWNCDDFYICDTSGSYNNDFLGDVIVEHLRPIAPNIQSDLMGSDGDNIDNWAMVDDPGSLVTSDYVYSNTVGQRDIYSLSAPLHSTGVVKGVMALNTGERTDTDNISAKTLLQDSTGTSISTAKVLPYGSQGVVPLMKDRKFDGSAWAWSDLSTLHSGVEIA